jgi:hypothetical protein
MKKFAFPVKRRKSKFLKPRVKMSLLVKVDKLKLRVLTFKMKLIKKFNKKLKKKLRLSNKINNNHNILKSILNIKDILVQKLISYQAK